MANKTINVSYASGATGLTCNVHPVNGGAALNTSGAITLTESGTTPGLYQGVMSDAATGEVRVNVFRSSKLVGQFVAYLSEVVGYYNASDLALVDSLSDAALLAERLNLNGVIVTVNGPVFNVGGLLVIVLTSGDDYSSGDSRQISLTLNGTVLPTLAGATVELCLSTPGSRVVVIGSATVQTGSSRTVVFQPTAALTGLLVPSQVGTFAVKIITAGGTTITPTEARGSLNVLPKVA